MIKVVGFDGSTSGRYVVEAGPRRVAPNERLIIVHALEARSESTALGPGVRKTWEVMLAALDPEALDGIDY